MDMGVWIGLRFASHRIITVGFLLCFTVACGGGGGATGSGGSTGQNPSSFLALPAPIPSSATSCLTQTSIVPVQSGSTCTTGTPPGGSVAIALSGSQFVAYWEGDTDLTQLQHGVTIVIASFGYLNGHAITGADMGGALTASTIASLHQKGVKILLSLGGGGGTFQFDGDAQGFQDSIKSLVAQLPYDGIDFDDENEGTNILH